MKKNVYHLENKKNPKKQSIFSHKYKYYFIIFILLIIVITYYLIQLNTLEVIEARYGRVIDGFNTEAIIIREESIISAPVTGKVFLIQEEGKRIRYGKDTVKIDNQKIYNRKPGIISYKIDGLEHILSPENIYNISFDKFNNLQVNTNQLENEQYIFKGEPLYRIIDNNKLFLIFKAAREKAARFDLNELVFIKHENLRENITAKIKDVFIKNEQAVVTLELDRFIIDWIDIRRTDIKLIKNIYNGLIIPRSAVVKHQGDIGVFTLARDGEYKFKEIIVENSTQEKAIVTGINFREQVIVNPEVID